MKEITLDTKISELLNDYEDMKDILIDINPKFKKLNNPILKRTLAKVASVKKAAIVGGMNPLELLNKLREAVGQGSVSMSDDIEDEQLAPSWISNRATESLDANEILDNDENPLAKSYTILKRFDKDEILTISSDFRPEPLIDEFIKSGYSTYCQEVANDKYLTYIKK